MKAEHINNERRLMQAQISASIKRLNLNTNKSYFVETYGCQMNARDSETIAALLEDMGYTPANNTAQARLILFNTCCIRDHAEKKLMANIGALKERKQSDPELIIGVCGCMMQQEQAAKKLMKRFPYVNLTFGTNVLWRLPEMMSTVLQGERVCLTEEEGYAICEGLPARRQNPFSAYVNITYGCDNYCSYCIVPFVRGRERSRNIEDIVQECRELATL